MVMVRKMPSNQWIYIFSFDFLTTRNSNKTAHGIYQP